MEKKLGILIVSFGTSHSDTRKKTLDAIDESFKESFPEAKIYRAWTSKMIRAKVLKNEGIEVPSVDGALAQMAAEGITEAVIQSTHILKGIEYDTMLMEIESWKEKFSEGSLEIKISQPLISDDEDIDRALKVVTSELLSDEEIFLALMGHGTNHLANRLYFKANERLKALGFDYAFMGTVEGEPSAKDILEKIENHPMSCKRVKIAPFLMVAGEHAKKDLSGEDENSWEQIFKKSGYEVECVLKGLGEYDEIRNILVEHARETIK